MAAIHSQEAQGMFQLHISSKNTNNNRCVHLWMRCR